MRIWRRSAVCGVLLAFFTSGNAQPYTLESSTLDGGGGTSSGGAYTLTGTIGQPDAGTLSGGTFTLQGGFWPGVTSVPIPGGPTLLIEPLEGQVRLSWTPATPGFVLEQSELLMPNSWIPAPSGAQNPVTLPASESTQFFRLIRQ